MQSVLSRPKRKSSLPRNAFDRGFDIKFNCSAGMLLPVFCEPVLGKSHVKINRQQAFRAAQSQTAPFVRMNMNIDFYFVPFRLLYSYYGQSRTRSNDFHSSKLSKLLSTDIPLIDNEFIYALLNDTETWDELLFLHRDGACRLLDMLDYGVTPYDIYPVPGSREVMPYQMPSVNPLKLCAYQKVYFDHYRLSNYAANHPEFYNLDQFVNSDGIVSNISSNSVVKGMTQLRYAAYRKDFYNNIYPSLNFAASGTQIGAFNLPNNLSGLYATPPIEYDSDTSGAVYPVLNTSADAISANGIRALFALDKMSRLAAYAPQHVADQFEARYGFRPLGEDMNESQRIGSFTEDMTFSEVLSTADTDGAKLGTIGGRGYSVSDWSDTLEYDVKEDGIIIGLSYVLPRMSYDSFGIDSFNTIASFDQFPQPEFESISMEPFYQSELYMARFIEEDENLPEGRTLRDFNNTVRGYRPSWSRWKIGRDRNHGLFVDGKALSAFTNHTKFDYLNSVLIKSPDSGVSLPYFLASPRDLNSIFAGAYYDQRDDQFFGLIRFGFSCIQNFPVLGVPDL